VLCINQTNDEELRQEIAKQGAIFAEARGTLTYLRTIDSSDHLAQAICDLGNSVLQSIEISLNKDRSRSTYLARGIQDYRRHAESPQRDWWFTSLWTLQEMILFPSSIWIAGGRKFLCSEWGDSDYRLCRICLFFGRKNVLYNG
jgi:hypothetical protein